MRNESPDNTNSIFAPEASEHIAGLSYAQKGQYVWYRFHVNPGTKIEITKTGLYKGFFYANLYDSSLQQIGTLDDGYSTRLGQDTTHYVRLEQRNLYYGETVKAAFTINIIDIVEPTPTPTIAPTPTPTIVPTSTPTTKPTAIPTLEPTPSPAIEPTTAPTDSPDIGNIDSDFWTEDENTGSGIYDEELPVPEIKEVENGKKSVNIVWSCSNASDIDGYYKYRSKDGKAWTKIATINDTEIEDYEDTDVANGIGYGYIIRSYVGSDQSENSIPEYTCFLNRPSVKSVKSNASKKLTAKWSTNSKASGYHVRISTTKSFTKTTTEMKKINSKSKSKKTIGKLKGKTLKESNPRC